MKIEYWTVVTILSDETLLNSFYSPKEASDYIAAQMGEYAMDAAMDSKKDKDALTYFLDDMETLEIVKDEEGNYTYVFYGNGDFSTSYEVIKQEFEI